MKISSQFDRFKILYRLFRYVRLEVRDHHNNACWIWTGGTNKAGYGVFRLENKCCLASRVMWLLFSGEDPAEKDVLHRCDNPPCVNPSHLFLGTHQENMRDMVAKGRNVGGRTLLTPDLVLEIRELKRKTSLSNKDIGKKYGVATNTIWGAVHRVTWKHIP